MSALLLALLAQLGTASGDSLSRTAPLQVLDEGARQGAASEVNCSGAGVTCTRSGNRWTLDVSGGGGGAPTAAQYVTLVNDATLTAERVLTGTTNRITLTDNGPNNTVVLSTPQDIHTGASPSWVNTAWTGHLDILNSSPPAAPTAGRARLWSEDKNGHTLVKYVDDDDVARTLGRDNALIVRNTTGSTLLRGEVVYVSGSTGQTPNVARAVANNGVMMAAQCMVAKDTANNGFGYCMALGYVTAVDTSAWVEGTNLYLSASVAGGLTSTAPVHPNLRQVIGVVTNQHVNQGIIQVDITAPFGDFEGTKQSPWIVGPATGAGAVAVSFRNASTGTLSWTPTGTRTLTLPDVTGTLTTAPAACTGAQKVTSSGTALSCATDIDTVPATGACTNQFVRGVNGASAPTCATVALATDTSGTLAVGRGGTNLTASAEDNVMVGNTTTWESKTLPSCSGASNALAYNTATNAFSCNTISGGTDVTAEPFITKVASTPLTNEFALGSLTTGLLINTATTGIPTIKGTNACTNQFPRSDNASGTWTCASIATADLPAIDISKGGTTETASTEDAVLVGSSTTDWQPKVLPSCSNATTSKLLYDNSTNAFSCGTDQTGGGGGGGTTIKRVSSDQANTTTSFADVTDLTFTISATGTYAIHCNITYTSAATTTAIQMALNGPTASAIDYYVFTNTTATAKHNAVQTAYNTATNPATGGGAVRLGLWVDGTVVLTATGTLAVRFRSEVAASAVTVKRGSWCALDVVP